MFFSSDQLVPVSQGQGESKKVCYKKRPDDIVVPSNNRIQLRKFVLYLDILYNISRHFTVHADIEMVYMYARGL